MAFEVHAVVEHSDNFDLAVGAQTKNEKMPRLLYPSLWKFDAVSSVPKMIGPRGRRDFSAIAGTRSFGILSNVKD